MRSLLVAAVLVSLSLGVAAMPPNHPPEGPASIVITDPDPHLGEYVTFSVTAPKSHYDKRVQVLCYQQIDLDPDLDLVYAMAGPWDDAFQLGGGSSYWFEHDGTASCQADLYYWTYNHVQQFNLLASTTFEAQGR